MKWMQWVGGIIVSASAYAALAASLAVAAITIPPMPIETPQSLPASPVMITAYQAIGSSLQFVQLYNNSDDLVSLADGKLIYGYAADASPLTRELIVTDGLMKPRSHIILAVDGLLPEAAAMQFSDTAGESTSPIGSLAFLLPGVSPAGIPVAMKTNGVIQQRGKTTTGYSTVTYGEFSGGLYADKLYEVPDVPPLRIIEILPRAKECEPFSLDPTCGDYVKFKTLPGFRDDMLSLYRVRSDDSNESVTNTFSLAYASRHEDYILLRLRDDGQTISLTNGGGYVWVEDVFGVRRYEETLTSYADAGSGAYVDKSWALDERDNTWKWAIPSPMSVNRFPEILAAVTDTASDFAACPAGKYRNPETNRCRSIEEAVSALAVCEEGKERNPLTNRCRSIASTSVSPLMPCGEGEERNPATNRCRKVVATSSNLVPCQSGYERNPETNRCRKSASPAAPLSTPASALTENSSGSTLKNALIITAGLGAVGYGFYEWRSEVGRALRRLVAIVSRK